MHWAHQISITLCVNWRQQTLTTPTWTAPDIHYIMCKKGHHHTKCKISGVVNVLFYTWCGGCLCGGWQWHTIFGIKSSEYFTFAWVPILWVVFVIKENRAIKMKGFCLRLWMIARQIQLINWNDISILVMSQELSLYMSRGKLIEIL